MDKSTVTIGNLQLNKHHTHICVPIMEQTVVETIMEAEKAALAKPDLLEIRLDHLVESQLVDAADVFTSLKAQIPQIPLLATYRSQREGGSGALPSKAIFGLYRAIANTGSADLIDLEMSMELEILLEALDYFREKNLPVLLSYHNFNNTPEVEEMMAYLSRGEELGGQIVKIAVMPHTPKDVARLLTACAIAYDALHIPYLGIAMGALGKISRIGASAFGSCLTFGAEMGKASAPGQLEVASLRTVLLLLDENEVKP